jgi:hypothetical protein
LINREKKNCLRLLNKRDPFDKEIIKAVKKGELKIESVPVKPPGVKA